MITYKTRESQNPEAKPYQSHKLTSCDTQTGHEVISNGPDSCFPLQRCPDCLDEAIDGDADDEDDIQPVNVLVPVLSRDGALGDVRFLRIV